MNVQFLKGTSIASMRLWLQHGGNLTLKDLNKLPNSADLKLIKANVRKRSRVNTEQVTLEDLVTWQTTYYSDWWQDLARMDCKRLDSHRYTDILLASNREYLVSSPELAFYYSSELIGNKTSKIRALEFSPFGLYAALQAVCVLGWVRYRIYGNRVLINEFQVEDGLPGNHKRHAEMIILTDAIRLLYNSGIEHFEIVGPDYFKSFDNIVPYDSYRDVPAKLGFDKAISSKVGNCWLLTLS